MSLMALYMLCVAAGGVLMGTSILLGGDHDADADADLDVDAHLDLDVDHDLDLDVDHDLDLDADHDADLGHAGDLDAHHGGGFEWSVLPFGSLRFWTFLVESFGLTGALLSCAGLPAGATLGLALAAGTAVGWSAFLFFRWLAHEQVSGRVALRDYENSEGRVLVRIPAGGGQGKIAIDTAAGRVELLAATLDDREIPRGAQVLVVRVADGVAQVTALTPTRREASEAARDAVRAAAEHRAREKQL